MVLYIRDTRIDGPLIRRLGESCPNVIAVKYGVRDPVSFAAAARDAGEGRFTWLAGLAELTAPGLWPVGAQGFTSGLVNVVPQIPAAMLGALRRGDFTAAMAIWDADQAVRGAARRRLVGRQRHRGQGGPGAARSVRAGGPAAQPAAARLAAREQVAAVLVSWDARRAGGGVVTNAPKPRKTPQQLRSYRWFGERGSTGEAGMRTVSHRSRMRQLGVASPRSTWASR